MTSAADQKYAIAMAASGDLLADMRREEFSPDPVRSMMATIWLQRENVPFMATVHEAVAEVSAAVEQDPNAAMSPRPTPE